MRYKPKTAVTSPPFSSDQMPPLSSGSVMLGILGTERKKKTEKEKKNCLTEETKIFIERKNKLLH